MGEDIRIFRPKRRKSNSQGNTRSNSLFGRRRMKGKTSQSGMLNMITLIQRSRKVFKVTCSYCKKQLVNDEFSTHFAEDWNTANNVNHWDVFCNDRCLFLFKLKGDR